jgi:hypothetical protein
MVIFWDKRKQKLLLDVAVTVWMVSPLPEKREGLKITKRNTEMWSSR